MRQYQEIWERLKRDKKVTLSVHPQLVRRVKKAVMKEKEKDLGFKVLNDHDFFRLEIEYFPELEKLKFILKQKFGIEGVKGYGRS